jgi:hypothetical protein
MEWALKAFILIIKQDFLIKNQDFTNPDWFIIYKDAATSYGFSYQLNIIPLNFNDYIIGQNFYTENPLVMNQDIIIEKKLYIYTNGTTYNIFDDLKVKNGFSSEISIDVDNLVSDIETFSYNFAQNALTAINNPNVTSWAIGDSEGNLFLACNRAYNGFKLLTTSKVQTVKVCIQYYIWKKAVELYKLKRECKNKLNFKKRKKVVINIPPWN